MQWYFIIHVGTYSYVYIIKALLHYYIILDCFFISLNKINTRGRIFLYKHMCVLKMTISTL